MKKRDKMVISGSSFELFVGEILQSTLGGIVLYNYKVHSPRIHRGTESDIIFISDRGIFCIECKNYRGYIAGSLYEPRWRFGSSGRTAFVSNPVLGNYKHIRSIRGLSRKYNLGINEIHNYVCIPDSCRIHSDCDEVVSLSSLVSKINYMPKRYDSITINNIFENLGRIRCR